MMTETRGSSQDHSEQVLDHFMNPRNIGSIEDASVIGDAGNPADGDAIRLYLKIEESVISDAKVKVFGCPTAIAAGSVLTELIIGKSLAEALGLRNEDIDAALGGLPESKLHCSVMAEAVLEDAISRYRTGRE